MDSSPKYIINNKPENLTEEEINSTKDFKKLAYRYQKATTPLYKYKYRRVFMFVLLIVLIIWVLILMFE